MRTCCLTALLGVAVWGCGSTGGSPVAPTGAAISIVNYTYVPQRLVVTPGTTVNILNEDPFQHSVTSSSAPGVFAFGSVNGISFDTGPFTGNRAIAIPATAMPGTVVPYFCTLHPGNMVDQGEIAIVAPSSN
ncbi:MAG TPA: hypothetical protein VMK12_16035 [Anaeromyxobacteraceae bacterium]|nr:hypothetical protein [Anaeromyxobacteraceae bacterium]